VRLQKEHMKYLGVFAVGVLAAACSSNSPPPAASAESVDLASSTPSTGADFAPVANDGTASAASNGSGSTGTGSTGTGSTGTGSTGTGNTGSTTGAGSKAAYGPGSTTSSAQAQATNPTLDPPATNAAGLPAQNPTNGAPDNSRVNARDRDPKALTPMDQGGSEADRKITQAIRQAVVKDGSLSFTAKNVKIITINGKVTLRGPVKSDAERASIEAAAKSAAGVTQVDNQLEVKK